MAQQVRAPAEKPDDPSLIPGSGVRTNSSRLSADLWCIHAAHTHTGETYAWGMGDEDCLLLWDLTDNQ